MKQMDILSVPLDETRVQVRLGLTTVKPATTSLYRIYLIIYLLLFSFAVLISQNGKNVYT